MHSPRTSARSGARIFWVAVLLLLVGAAASSALAETFVVTSTADPGDGTCTAAGIGDGCTLREAIDAANADAGADTIDATAVSGTIGLTAALPDLSSDITIVGPGATLLEVKRIGSARFRIFTIPSGVAVNLSGLSVTGGWTVDGVGPFSGGGAGGGISSDGTLTITRCTVSGNQTGNGGAGSSSDGHNGNGGSGGIGGGIATSGTLTMIESTVSGNQTGHGGTGAPGGGGGFPAGPGGAGGGLYTGGVVTLINCTVSGNRTGDGALGPGSNYSIAGVGGGICNGGTLTLSNCTISGNQTGDGGWGCCDGGGYYGGGGLFIGGSVTISNTTIVGNRAEYQGGGIYRSLSGGTITLRSTIVAGNYSYFDGWDIFRTIQSDGYNLIGNQAGATISPNPGAGPDFFGDAQLDSLADNGGPTRTHLPRGNSPALDKGKNFSSSSTDQRGLGFARVVDLDDATFPNAGDGTDIGAVELAGIDGILQFTAAAQTIGEELGSITVTVSRTGASNGAVSVFYKTTNGSATAGPDYTAVSGTLHWAAGDTADKSFTVSIMNDWVFEADETFFVDLSFPGGGAALGMPVTQTITIQNDDPMPTPTATAAPTPTATAIPTATATPTTTATATPTAAPVIARNISTRARIETGDEVMIAGFIIKGSALKKVVIRGLGPSLQDVGIGGFLADPVLELRGSNGAPILVNDNWHDDAAQAAQIQASGLALTRSQESAIVIILTPGTYTAVVRGKNNATGVGLVEVYDVDNAQSELANISTRSFVQLQDNVMIGGFTLGDGIATNLALRALGPSLASGGISNALADPTLDVRDSNGNQIDSNDNWQDDPAKAAQITAAGLAPTNNNESAIPLTLPPGQYAAIVRGKNNGVGVGLIEIYDTH